MFRPIGYGDGYGDGDGDGNGYGDGYGDGDGTVNNSRTIRTSTSNKQ